MGKLDDKVEELAGYMSDKLEIKKVDRELLHAVAKSCGPSLYKNDASRVSSSDKKELETVRNNFLIKKLGLKFTPKLDEGINAVIEIFGRSNRNKQRAVFYYLLAKHFRKGSFFKK